MLLRPLPQTQPPHQARRATNVKLLQAQTPHLMQLLLIPLPLMPLLLLALPFRWRPKLQAWLREPLGYTVMAAVPRHAAQRVQWAHHSNASFSSQQNRSPLESLGVRG